MRLIYFKIHPTSLILNLLELLYVNGIIDSFKIFQGDYVCVYLKYFRNHKHYFRLELCSRPGKKHYNKLIQLSRKLHNYCFSCLYVISTSKGLQLISDAVYLHHIGGEILLKIHI